MIGSGGAPRYYLCIAGAQEMLSDSRGSVIISSLGWVDRGALWIMSAGSGHIETVLLRSCSAAARCFIRSA
jgi:hypothetical protein